MSVKPIQPPAKRPQGSGPSHFLARLPYWLLAAILLAILFLWRVFTNVNYTIIFKAVVGGVGTTIWVTLVAYTGALLIGLLIGLLRITRNRVLFEITSFYVEIVRGVPVLVLLYYIAFVAAPELVTAINWAGVGLDRMGLHFLGLPLMHFQVRNLDFAARAILALIIGYSAFISEIFRAGIESIERGQTEAALSLGMTRWQTLRLIILPQAIRRVLPPLGNDFIAMLKDSSLVSALGVQDITRIGNTYSASTFRYFETYNVVAFLYLVMTVGLALLVRYLEKRMPNA
ncbi:MAG: amino acid ABC transporter permease [Chloroflexi bacterium]|nr:amino acid ABC transporter permease [Chloroflexota bacterium]